MNMKDLIYRIFFEYGMIRPIWIFVVLILIWIWSITFLSKALSEGITFCSNDICNTYSIK